MCRHQSFLGVLITVIAACLIGLPTTLAGKPDKPAGGKGGGGNNSVSYEIVQLDSIGGSAEDINEYGEVVGYAEGQPTYWQVIDGQPVSVVSQPLSIGGITGVTGGFARAINDNGAICGSVSNVDLTIHVAVFWPSAGDEPIQLSADAGALDVNNNGIVVGGVGGNAAAWHVAGDGTVVGPVLLGGSGPALSINDSNLVVGSDAWPHGQAVAWLLDWDGNSLNVVTQWPVVDPSGLDNSVAESVNEAGDIVGELQFPGYSPEAFFVNAALELQTLPSLVDNRKKYTLNERVRDINNASPPQILGYANVRDRRYGGQQTESSWVIWQGDSVLSLKDALGSSPPNLQYVQALNDSGWIVGSAAFTYPSEGIYYPFVMIAR